MHFLDLAGDIGRERNYIGADLSVTGLGAQV